LNKSLSVSENFFRVLYAVLLTVSTVRNITQFRSKQKMMLKNERPT